MTADERRDADKTEDRVDRPDQAETQDRADLADDIAPWATPDATAQGFVAGQRIGDYHVKHVIASGGMGTVYLATQDQPRRTVALKLLKAGVVSRSALRRFEFEAQILARLHHPGIAQVYDAGTHDDGRRAAAAGVHHAGQEADSTERGVPYFAMEYIPNARTLTEYAESAALSTNARLELFARVCDAVHHGHQKGIIHRDLKPSNILVDADGQPKVIDFGVARATDSDMAVTTLQTDVGQLVGTVQYMSPEQVEADPHNIDTRSDVYTLGVVLYELLTGQLPYRVHDKPIYEAIRLVREQPATRPSVAARPLDRDVETIVLKTLEKDRSRRYQSADELRQDLLRFLQGAPITARAPSVAYQLSVFTRKNKALVGAAVALLVVLLAGTIGTTAGMIRATRGMNLARDAERNAQREAERATAVRDFLKRMLASANPFLPSRSSRAALEGEFTTTFAGTSGRDVAAADLLLQAAETLETSFDETPEIKAELRHTLGETLLGLGQIDESQTQLDLAVALRSRVLGPDHPDTARSRTLLADVLVWQGQGERADRVYAQAHTALAATLGPAAPETMEVAGRRAGALMHRGKLDEAVDLQLRTLEMSIAERGEDDPATLEQMVRMCFMYWTKSDFDQAVRYGERAVAGLERIAGPDAQSTAQAKDMLAGALRSAGRPTEARRYAADALQAIRRNMGNEHPDTLFCMRNLANVDLQTGDYESANRLYREVLAAQRRLLPPMHVELLLTLNDFAAALAIQRADLETAETYAREARAGLEQVYGSETQYALNAADTLAMVLRRRGDTESAIAVYEQILEVAERRGLQLSVPVLAHLGLGQCYTDIDRFEDAQRHLRRAVEVSGAADDDAQLQAWRIPSNFVALYEKWGKAREAEAWRERVISDQ